MPTQAMVRAQAAEAQFVTEPLPGNAPKQTPFFGTFFDALRGSLAAGGSEMGLGLTLFSLITSIQARHVVEIGRFRGFSTLAMASALRFLDEGWQEPELARQRPDVDYERLEAKYPEGPPRRLVSIDPFPTDEAYGVIRDADLDSYIEWRNERSEIADVEDLEPIDVLFVDGDHRYQAVLDDLAKYVPRVRPGGYFVLHDYYGWYDREGRNGSPIKKAVQDLVFKTLSTSEGSDFENWHQHLLIDTGYASFVVFRKPS